MQAAATCKETVNLSPSFVVLAEMSIAEKLARCSGRAVR